jgi:exopolysaccharide production protein ExoZ
MAGTYQNVQALRGVACLAVILFHLAEYEQLLGLGFNPLAPLRWFGYAGVDLFFVISGFIIATANAKHIGQPDKVPGYLLRRFWRVVPPYSLWFFLFALPIDVLYFGYSPWEGVRGEAWWNAVLLLPGVPAQPWIPQAWTLTYELAFYAAFAIVLALPKRWGTGLILVWAGLLIIHRATMLPTPTLMSNLWFGPFVIEFLLGVVIAKTSNRIGLNFANVVMAGGLIWFCVAFALTVRRDPMAMPANQLTRVLVFGIPSATLVLFAVVRERFGWRIIHRGLLKIGDASYSLYLTHYTVLVVGYKITAELGWHHSRLLHLVWLATLTAAMIVVGLCYHRRVEKPLLNWLNRRLAKPVIFKISQPEQMRAKAA